MLKRCGILSLGLMAALSVTSGAVQAGAIDVPNGSFESPVIDPATPYTTTAAQLLPWVGQWVAEYRPDAYYAAFGEGGATPADGINVGYLNPGGSFRPFFYQTLGTSFEAGQDYTLKVAASIYQNAINEGQLLSLQLGYWEGDPNGDVGPTIVAERQIAGNELINWTMQDFSASTGILAGDAAAVGKPIVVYIGRAAGSVTGPQWVVDNVRLTATPEPGTLLLLVGLLGLRARRNAGRR